MPVIYFETADRVEIQYKPAIPPPSSQLPQSHLSSQLAQAVGPLMGLLLSMSTLYPVSRFIKLLVDEKESR